MNDKSAREFQRGAFTVAVFGCWGLIGLFVKIQHGSWSLLIVAGASLVGLASAALLDRTVVAKLRKGQPEARTPSTLQPKPTVIVKAMRGAPFHYWLLSLAAVGVVLAGVLAGWGFS